VSERDEFLEWVASRLEPAEFALHDGDAWQRAQLWSLREPVSVLGAWQSAIGQDEVRRLFADLGTTFSDCRSFSYDVVVADVLGDMAYTVGYEHTSTSVNGEPRSYSLRVTQIYRHEDGEWRVVHRHADTLPDPDGS
jgi:ketosteroid isomerase-like protein